MTATPGAEPPTAVLGLGLDIGGPWHHRAAQRNRALVQTYLLPPPPPTTAAGPRTGKTPVRLPSLTAKGPRRRGSMARLSLSEPSLLTPNENALFEGFSSIRRPNVLQKRAPPAPPFSRSSTLIPCKTCHPSGSIQPQQHQDQQQTQSCTRSTYIHFCQTVQPSLKPKSVRRHSHNPAQNSEVIRGDPRPLVMQERNALTLAEPLSVIGKPCLPSCGPRPILATAAANGQKRTQLHVFLPTEAEGEEVDSESVDEGFMDELDSKITSLKLQQGAPKTVTYH